MVHLNTEYLYFMCDAKREFPLDENGRFKLRKGTRGEGSRKVQKCLVCDKECENMTAHIQSLSHQQKCDCKSCKFLLEKRAKPNPKTECECGGQYSKHTKYSHRKTKRHQSFINKVVIKL